VVGRLTAGSSPAKRRTIEMAWKSGSSGFEFEGKITRWLSDFRKWYSEDARSNRAISEMAYVQHITLVYATLAKGKWQNEILGKRKASRLDSFTTQTAEGKVSVSLWDLLDYMAETLADSARLEWSKTARLRTKQLLHLE
jgi:hypothetical protein